MLDLLLDERLFPLLLVAGAVLTPLGAMAWWKLAPPRRRRPVVALGAAGPLALVLWLLHNALLAVLGFATVVGVLAILALGAAVGTGIGLWVRAES